MEEFRHLKLKWPQLKMKNQNRQMLSKSVFFCYILWCGYSKNNLSIRQFIKNGGTMTEKRPNPNSPNPKSAKPNAVPKIGPKGKAPATTLKKTEQSPKEAKPRRTAKKASSKGIPPVLFIVLGAVLLLGIIGYFLFGGSGNTPKEEKTFQGKLYFELVVEGGEEIQKAIRLFAAMIPERMEYTFWGENFRMKTEKKNGKIIRDFVVKEGSGYFIRHDKKEMYTLTPESLKEQPERQTQEKVTKYEETQEILGYLCHKYDVETQTERGQPQKLTVWATPDLKVKYPKGASKFVGNDGIQFKEIPGTPLKIISEIPIPNGPKGALVMTAERLQLTIEDNDFELPSSYKEKDYSVIQIEQNELQVVGALRSLSTAQNQFQNAGAKDRDQDGVGEYGYFVELSGVVPVLSGETKQPVADPFIDKIFGETSSLKGGIATKSGYCFVLYLAGETNAQPENGREVGPSSNTEEINGQETRWLCYAWPISKGSTGEHCFVVNQSGEVLRSKNADYSGSAKIPPPESAFMKESVTLEMAKNLDGELANKTPSHSGFDWEPTY